MTRTAWPTFASNDTMTAAQFNALWRDNDLAYWPFSARGDLGYRDTTDVLKRLAIGAAGKVLTSNGSAPTWASLAFAGLWKQRALVDVSPDADFGSGFADITGCTTTLTLPVTSSIVVIAAGSGYEADETNNLRFRAVVNGVADGNPDYMLNYGYASTIRREALFYIYLKTGVTAGSRIVKLQCAGSGHLYDARMIVWAFGE